MVGRRRFDRGRGGSDGVGARHCSADSPPGSGDKGATSSESAKPTENKADSDTPKKDAAADPTTAVDEPDETKPPDPAARREADGRGTVKDVKPTESDTAEKIANQPLKRAALERKPAAKPAAKQDIQEPAAQESIETTVEAAVVPTSRSARTTATLKTAAAPQAAAVAFAAAAPSAAEVTSTAAATPLSGLLSAIGTIVFNLYGFATRLVGGPPTLPPNSTVTVRSSTLRLDCGCDEGDEIVVPADWYVPDSAKPPTGLIYLQHGFLAQGPWYSHTAAALAEQTNSIVVAPSITSNFLASDACWLGAPPMQEAVANLFEDENTALAESALAAGYSGPIPDQVVLMGHSLGGGLVAGAAGFMVTNETVDRLAGVVMLDGVGFEVDAMATSLGDVPDDIPIYQLAAPRYFWNQFGVGTDALLEARPDTFIGVTLVGGSHVDSMRGGNPLIQFSQQLVSGFSKPQNVAAAQILMVGWVRDMFAGTQDDGIYLDPGEEFVLDTPAGQATLVDLPNSLTKPFLLNPLQALVPMGNGFFTFEPACVAESIATKGCTDSIAA